MTSQTRKARILSGKSNSDGGEGGAGIEGEFSYRREDGQRPPMDYLNPPAGSEGDRFKQWTAEHGYVHRNLFVRSADEPSVVCDVISGRQSSW
jgi:hypothetical protein